MSTKDKNVKVKEYKRKTTVKAHTRHKPTTSKRKPVFIDDDEPKNKLKAIKYEPKGKHDDEPKNKLKAIKYEPKGKQWVKIGESTGGNRKGKREVFELQD